MAALLSVKLSGAEASMADRAEADRLARTALRRDPTAVAAAATLGINAEIRGDRAAALRSFAYSQMLSRRELRTQLWAIEHAVGRDDITTALYHYDVALRTSRMAPDLLFPILTSAIADAPIRTALANRMAARPAWSDLFVAYVAGNGPDGQATAAFFTELNRHRVPISEMATAALITRLLSENHLDAAWAYYAAITPGADRRMSHDPEFAVNRTVPSAFDWTPVSDSGVSAAIQRDGEHGVFDFLVPVNVGGAVLRQTQLLPPGAYALTGRSANIEQSGRTSLYWMLSCADGRELGRVIVPPSTQNGGNFAGRFTVPADCPHQQLTLMVQPSDEPSGVSGQISSVQLRPTG
ncbi:hypothetical protein [Sphingomonas xinjiangensis]|uniref:Uncharacterized protein n=1 Tax=Sphingomonas xinjiangensis TaxID=643568 RepID=A0A840YSW6_9SPHN|nr:hypothetical protein [Sphingomonas xinjiangensis]MBB5712768.1 hypothetical protein [Sphingomonas xinjiangensis]